MHEIVTSFGSEAVQRLSVLVALPELFEEMGGDIDALRRDIGVGPDFFGDPEARIPFSLFCRVLGRAAEMAGCDHFGLLLGARQDEGILGLPGQWLRQAPTLGEGIAGFCALQAANTRAASLYLHRLDENAVFLGYGIFDRSAAAQDQTYALVIALALRAIRRVTGVQILAEEALFPFRAPVATRAFDEVLSCPLRFDQTRCGLILRRETMDLAVSARTQGTLVDWLVKAQQITTQSDRIWTARTAHALRPLIHDMPRKRAQVAATLGVSVRTLARRLAEEGTDFSRVHDDLRFTAAQELLALTDMPLGEVGHAVDFDSQAAFTRAFRRWSGVLPSDWRAQVALNGASIG
jgi:AraC-like DNA-binding protein